MQISKLEFTFLSDKQIEFFNTQLEKCATRPEKILIAYIARDTNYAIEKKQNENILIEAFRSQIYSKDRYIVEVVLERPTYIIAKCEIKDGEHEYRTLVLIDNQWELLQVVSTNFEQQLFISIEASNTNNKSFRYEDANCALKILFGNSPNLESN